MARHDDSGAPPVTSFDLRGKKGLEIGIANHQSIASGCARAVGALGGELAITYLNQRAEPLLWQGGTLLATSYLGAQEVVADYNLMGPVKAALEAVVRELASELRPQGIRVHALLPGPILTRAASGIAHFDVLLADTVQRAPQQRLVTIDEVGAVAASLAGD